MPAKLVTYNSQNYVDTLGPGLSYAQAVKYKDELNILANS